MKLSEDTKAWHSKLCDMSTHEIVKLMTDEGIKAYPKNASSCAVSQLIRRKTGQDVITTIYQMREPVCWAEDPENPETLDHSTSLHGFITNFDNGLYPELIA